MSDGAAAVVIASEDALKAHKLTPLARIVAYHISGCDPSIMGIGEGSVHQHTFPDKRKRIIHQMIHDVCNRYRPCACHHRSSEEGWSFSQRHGSGGGRFLLCL